ncbi:MAG: hypothetical protein IPH22_12540 [Nitrosomonas sp.]|nr:hypothetical protein [Nitrosomonas sp.]
MGKKPLSLYNMLKQFSKTIAAHRPGILGLFDFNGLVNRAVGRYQQQDKNFAVKHLVVSEMSSSLKPKLGAV